MHICNSWLRLAFLFQGLDTIMRVLICPDCKMHIIPDSVSLAFTEKGHGLSLQSSSGGWGGGEGVEWYQTLFHLHSLKKVMDFLLQSSSAGGGGGWGDGGDALFFKSNEMMAANYQFQFVHSIDCLLSRDGALISGY